VELGIELDADFADIFEARGARRRRRRVVTREKTSRSVTFTYESAGYRRSTRVTFSRAMESPDGRFTTQVVLRHGRPWDINVTIDTRRSQRRGVPPLPADRLIATDSVRRWRDQLPALRSPDVRLERACRRGATWCPCC
jgi:hypothetical protein